jgi:predicted nuclease of predicted toxin-antitoxin system
MRIKLDENIPHRLTVILEQMGHDVDTVFGEGLNGKSDDVIWEAVRQNDRFLITQDLDFSNIHQFAPGTHAGILILRLHDPGRENLFRKILTVFQREDVESWKQCFVVISDRKLRVRRPPSP